MLCRNDTHDNEEHAMKTAALVLTLLFAVPLSAQEQTLVGSAPVDNGGYGALVTKFSPVNHTFGVLMGARGGWIINHTFSLGLAGYGLVNEVPARVIGPLGEKYLTVGYGGLDLEYIAHSNELVHYSLHTLIGAGAVAFRNDSWERFTWDVRDDGNPWRTAFFVFEPGVNIDLNITTWFRVSAGAAYRFVGGVASDASSGSDLSGPSGMLTLRFGSF